MRRKAAKPNKAKPSRETVVPPSGVGTPDPMMSVKFWFGPVPHDHTKVPCLTPRLAKVALLKVMLLDKALPET